MKYLKQYEELNQIDYKVGDFIIANKNFSNRYPEEVINFLSSNVSEIISLTNTMAQSIRSKYDDEIPDGFGDKTGKFFNSWYFKPTEIRLATPEEIEEHKLKNAANKYNL